MNHSSEFCHAQAAQQRARASNANLQNVRRIAEHAVVAWTAEATLAEGRERRRQRVATVTGVSGAAFGADDELPEDCRVPDNDEVDDEDPLVLGVSENPDRTRADP